MDSSQELRALIDGLIAPGRYANYVIAQVQLQEQLVRLELEAERLFTDDEMQAGLAELAEADPALLERWTPLDLREYCSVPTSS